MNESKFMQDYFKKIDGEVRDVYDFANKAKSKSFDPDTKVDIVIAKNMAERVEGLISVVAPQIKGSGLVERIKELEKQYGSQDWRVALSVVEDVAKQKFCKFEDEKEAMEVAIRVGLAYITVGVVASPLEGFVRLELKDRKDGEGQYFALFFSGPIRSAGGTAAAVSVIIADYVRMVMDYKPYDATEDEIKRTYTELSDFHERITNLQYFPSEEEVTFLVKHLPVQIDGDPSEKIEVSNYKDLDRIETNRIRNGICLVIGEALTQKASKIWGRFSKWHKDFKMDQWDFLKEFVEIQKKVKAKKEIDSKDEGDVKITPDFTFIKDLVAGRPVFTHPLAKGGFRLRYGRSRVSGFSSQSMHPATMVICDSFIASGTQLKVERPGKATVISCCDSLEGPIVKLKNGDVIFIETEEDARNYINDIEEIIFLGDVLINFGDFWNRAHRLVPPGYCEEWWIQEVEKAAKEKNIDVLKLGIENYKELLEDPINTKIGFQQAIIISEKLDVPMHPRYTYHWKDIETQNFLNLIEWLEKSSIKKDKIIFPLILDLQQEVEKGDPKRVLELLGVPHKVVTNEHVVLEGDDANAFAASLGFYSNDLNEKLLKDACQGKKDVLEVINSVSEMKLRDKSGIFIGARMGRPEKAKMRKLNGSPQVLFPVGTEGGKMRSFQAAMEKGKVTSDFSTFFCKDCNLETIYPVCDKCGKKVEKRYYCYECKKSMDTEVCKLHGELRGYKRLELDLNRYFTLAKKQAGLKIYPELIKGVKGTSNREHVPENLVKGFLRAKHNLYVNKDGTIRYDMTETAITHFKPKEIKTSIEVLKKLGYTKDIHGKELKNNEQVIEIFPQDVILPACQDSLEEGADDVLLRVTKFLDDLLVKYYNSEPFYKANKAEDLAGQLVLCMSPHTCAAIVGRVIGFSNTQGFLAHPTMHSIMRRDCDGDEAGVMLMLDAFLNFSRQFLPDHRGGNQDEPLVLTSKLIPTEVDDMVFDMDIVWKYPLEFYEACLNWEYPWDQKILRFGEVLDTEKQYEGMGYTHETTDINAGVRCSSYKTIPTMQEKVLGQMELAEKIRAVDEIDAASLVIERHFIRDIKGNLRKFSMQKFRCVNCNEKFRRPPIVGNCTKCGGKIIFTIAEGSVVKYMDPSLSLADKYDLPAYLKQTLELTKQRIESVFGKDPDKQEGLGKWFNPET